jgi:sarcosine oxidase, subunit beta
VRHGAEAVVVGAGVVGASAAFHLAERGVDVLVIDRGGPAAGSTARSGALIRCHYPTVLEAGLAWESLTDYFEAWADRVGGGCGFIRTGFAHLASEENAQPLRERVAVQQSAGVETSLLTPDELSEIDPSLDTRDVALAAYEPRGGYADPTATTVSLMNAAQALGARFERREATALVVRRDRVGGVETTRGIVAADTVVLAAGAWSVPLAATAGLRLPIRPARVRVALFERPYSLPTHLTLIDSIGDFYARPTAERATLIGTRASLEWVEDPSSPTPDPDTRFVSDVSDRLAARIPALSGAPYRAGRSGILDMTPDDHAVLGPAGPDGLFLAAGWSGTGFKKAPAVGAELAAWIHAGAPRRSELQAWRLDRFDPVGITR